MKMRFFPAVLLLICSASLPAVADNLLQNPGFEIGTPGPGVAAYWFNYGSVPPTGYQIMSYATDPWAVYEERQSQMCYSSGGGGGGGGGIYQEVTGFGSGTYEVSVFVKLKLGAGPTEFRVGYQPGGGPPIPGAIIYGDTIYLSAEWQQATVVVAAAGPTATVVLEGAGVIPGGNFGGVVDNGVVQPVQLCKMVLNVPDACQPPNNPLNINNTTNWCSPTAAVNVTWFWDQVVANPPAPGVNDNWFGNTANAYIGWWMDTNDLGCPNRMNGNTLVSALGTYVGDIGPGISDYARWDSTHAQGCVPPAVPASKNGYDWTVTTFHNQSPNYGLGNALSDINTETSEGRPLLVTWCYWNLNKNSAWTDPVTGIVYYDWGPPLPASAQPDPSEQWNNYENRPDQPKGDQQIGHTVTVVGWCNKKDPDGGGALPNDCWIICHDTWPLVQGGGTPKDVAVPWNNVPLGASAWVSNTLVRPKGTLDVSVGPMSPSDHWTPTTTVKNVMAQVRLTAGPSENVTVQQVVLQASGTGNSVNDITRVDLVLDADSDGLWDVAEVSQANAVFVPGAPPTCTLNLAAAFFVPAGQSRDLLIVYTMKAVPPLPPGFTYKCTITSMTATGQRSGLAISPRGLPFTSSLKTLIAGPCVYIPNVPDIVQPPNNPLAVPNVTNWCAGAAAANITYYWAASGDARATGVNDNWVQNDGQYYMGWWMDTNNFGCQFRLNATKNSGGTYVADLAPGVAEYARWDANNSFGVINPLSPQPVVYPVLPVSKKGYSWTCSSKTDAVAPCWAQAWTDMCNEIDAGRPVLVTWRYWNLVAPPTNIGGVDYYTWGVPIQGAQGESWNDESNQNEAGAGDLTIGHVVTVVGYCPNYNGGGLLPLRDWVICHDTWANGITGPDVAVPWYRVPPLPPPNPPAVSAWAANTFVRLAAPAKVGKLTAQGAFLVGINGNFNNKIWVAPGTPNVCVVSMSLAADATESVIVNVIELVASGSGNDAARIDNVRVFYDDDADGTYDPPGSADPDQLVASGRYPADNGTLRLVVVGPSALAIPAGTSKRIFVVYDMNAFAPALSTYTCTVQNIYATGGTTFLPVTVSGLPYTGLTVGIQQIVVPPAWPPGKIGWWKGLPDGTQTTISLGDGPVISSGTDSGGNVRLGDKIYVENADRSSGIQVYVAGTTPGYMPEGAQLSLEAVIDTIDGERVLVQPQFLAAAFLPTPLGPLALCNKSTGGGDWEYNAGTGAGQKGILDAYGLNNIGLLVRAFGRVLESDPEGGWFTLEDGSGVLPALKVKLPDGWTGPIPTPPEYAAVSGICSCEKEEGSGDLYRLIRVRMTGDVEEY